MKTILLAIMILLPTIARADSAWGNAFAEGLNQGIQQYQQNQQRLPTYPLAPSYVAPRRDVYREALENQLLAESVREKKLDSFERIYGFPSTNKGKTGVTCTTFGNITSCN